MKQKTLILIALFFIALPTVFADVGYEYLDGGSILHIWNEYDDYYIDTSSGIQLTNNYEEYWSKNTFCGGVELQDWQYYCTDTLPFNWTLITDDNTYVNYTGVRSVLAGPYQILFSLTYHLGSDDSNLTIVPAIENLGSKPVRKSLRFAWRISDIQIDMGEEDNLFSVFQNSTRQDVNLSDSVNETFTDLTLNQLWLWKYVNGSWIDLWLAFGNEYEYSISVASEEGQYNAPVTLFIDLGDLDKHERKELPFQWLDRLVSCSPGMNPTLITITYYRNGVTSTQALSEEQINMQLEWWGPALFPGTCNAYFEQKPNDMYASLSNSYPESEHAVFRVTDWNNFVQGQQLAYSTPYNMTVHCGQKNGTAIGHGWVGGLSSADFNLSCNSSSETLPNPWTANVNMSLERCSRIIWSGRSHAEDNGRLESRRRKASADSREVAE
ncbi:MAG: hypothetical protein ABIJ21_04775 [Nanoarchaeota archaeon]